MNEVEFSDEIIGYFPCKFFAQLRDHGDLLDVRFVTQEGIVTSAHRLVLLARFPALADKLMRGGDLITLELKRFSYDIVEAVVNYAYTGKLVITPETALRLYLIAQNLGCQIIVSWCVEYLKSRLTVDNVVEVWSVANSTENEELINLCLPLVAANFAGLCQMKNFLANTTSTSFRTLLERVPQGDITEDLKIQTILEWLDAGFNAHDSEERICNFKTLIPMVNLAEVSRSTLMQIWHTGRLNGSTRCCRSHLIRAWTQAQSTSGGVLGISNQRPNNNIFVYGWEKSTRSWMISSIPQLQPEKSVNVRVPFNGEAIICGAKVFIFGGNNTKHSLVEVDLSTGNTTNPPVALQPRDEYSSTVKNNSIFLFGGCYNGNCLSVCEKYDTRNNTISNLPNMLNVRCGSSALNIPEMGIIVVGGCDKVRSAYPTLRSVEMLVENENEEGGMKWVEFPSMLKERYRPGIAFFQGCAVVAGGDMNCSVEYFPIATKEYELPQWTFLDGIGGYGLEKLSLVTFNGRLLLKLSDSEGHIYEFSETSENRALPFYKWRSILKVENFLAHKLLVSEEVDES